MKRIAATIIVLCFFLNGVPSLSIERYVDVDDECRSYGTSATPIVGPGQVYATIS